MRADVVRFLLADPSDVSGLKRAIRDGVVDPKQIVTVVGKTHGNGLVNDYTRGYLAQSLSLTIGEATGESHAAVRDRIPFIFSGGVEGVLSPHYVVFTVAADHLPPIGKALAPEIAFTPQLNPEDIGQRQIDLTAAAIIKAMAAADFVDPADVHFVQVKGPAFALADIAASQRAGFAPASDNPGKLMGLGRAASAFGVGKALGEIAAEPASEAALRVLLRRQLLGWGRSPRERDRRRWLRAAFVKCEASPDGLVRGNPHAMLNDGDIDQQRHIRAAVGAIAASVLNDTALFVSGGAEHQG